MIYNDKITSEYGTQEIFVGVFPIACQPKPTDKDYKQGFIVRWFAMRINDATVTEINPEQREQIGTSLYATVSLIWKISGPKDSKIVNGIIEKSGITKENQNEIERVKRETGVDLSKTLTNPLELWRGY
jgi:hypothetical protein